MDEMKQEQLAEKIIELLAVKIKRDFKELYYEIANPILDKYKYVHNCFIDSVSNKSLLEKAGVSKDYLEPLYEMVLLRNKPKDIEIKEEVTLKTYESDGVETIKRVLKDALKVSDKIAIKYHGAGIYDMTVTDIDFKEAEKIAKKAGSIIEKEFENHGEISIKRLD